MSFPSREQQRQTDLRELVRLEEVRNLSRAQDVVDVLQEGLVHNLSVVEEEDGGPVLHATQPVQTLDV